MNPSSSPIAKAIAAILLTTLPLLNAPSPAMAGERYGMRQAVEVSPQLQQNWLLQLGQAPRVNGAGVVFSRQPATAHSYQTSASRSIFSPYPFGRPEPRAVQRQPVQRNPGQRQSLQRGAAYRATSPAATIDPLYLPQRVAYSGGQAPGTIVISTADRFLYLVGPGGSAMRYGIGVGKPGFSWRGSHNITRKAEWPGWTPPKEMIAREKRKGRILPAHMEGGPGNPLGARAMYLGSTLYRIHGTNQPWTIGQAVSSGCIRMRNEDVIDLYERVGVGTKVVVM
ncbi:L,D-transpeptidase [Fulvimarina manganoxydans]|uniref:L,D-transpeptidase n=1 Tax=Fulvimarina manganoxydans TaxID=937218 RepID=UPI003B58EAC5